MYHLLLANLNSGGVNSGVNFGTLVLLLAGNESSGGKSENSDGLHNDLY